MSIPSIPNLMMEVASILIGNWWWITMDYTGQRQEEGYIGLSKGFHKIKVLYFEKTGSDDLKVYIKSPTLKKQILPNEWLYH